VFTIPGNHDVIPNIAGRHLIQALHHDIKSASVAALDGVLRGLLSDPETSRLLYESIGPYNTFAGQFFCDLLPPERTISRRDLVQNDRSILRVSGFNSAFVSSAADKPGDLFVDPASTQLIRERGVEHLCHVPPPLQLATTGRHVARLFERRRQGHLFGHEHTNRIEMGKTGSASQPAQPIPTGPNQVGKRDTTCLS
jgi:hypothetical protein